MEPCIGVTAHDKDKQAHSDFLLALDGFDETGTFMPSPFCTDVLHAGQGGGVDQQEVIDASSPANLGPIAIPTPPPELTYSSPDSARSHSSCISPQHSASATSDSYIKGSSLEESPVSSPSSSCAEGLDDSSRILQSNFSNPTECPSLVKRETCIHDAGLETAEMVQAISEEEAEAPDNSNGHSVPKNIKLPQRKGGMQLWQFLYALLSDPEKKYGKLIEWTANSHSREFRLLEPEAIAIWWGEHKNKKNMSYDKLSRSLRYYYDKGIIRKISGERYVYQFCISPELMYKHIGNSDSRPKLKPMPHSAYQVTSEYQSQHCLSAPTMMNRDPCFIAQGPMSLGMGVMHGHLVPPRSGYLPPPNYNSGFLSHDITPDLHLGAYNSAFFPSASYDTLSAMPHMSASLGYAQLQVEPQLPIKSSLPPLRKSYELPLTPTSLPKYEGDALYGKSLLSHTSSLNHLKYDNDSFVKSPMLHPSSSSSSVVLSPHTLSPPPLTSNAVASPMTPSFPNQGSPLSHSYSNHSSPHTYSAHTANDPLFDELIPFTSTEEYPSTYHTASYSCNSNTSHIASANTWEEM